MSYIRITELAGRPLQRDGEWFAPEGREGSLRLERDVDLSTQASTASAVGTVNRWEGARIFKCGSDQRGSLAYLLKYPVPLDYLYEFDAWFQYEHMPILLEEPTWYGCEFFRSLGASCYSYVALHYLEPQALASDARNRSVDTPWWHRLKQHDWFDKQFVRIRMKPL